jgi:hypothetical protein
MCSLAFSRKSNEVTARRGLCFQPIISSKILEHCSSRVADPDSDSHGPALVWKAGSRSRSVSMLEQKAGSGSRSSNKTKFMSFGLKMESWRTMDTQNGGLEARNGAVETQNEAWRLKMET